MTGLVGLLLLTIAAATPSAAGIDDGDEPPPAGDVPPAGSTAPLPPVDAPQPRLRRWGGLVIPLIGASGTDGFGFGLGGEVFRRPADGSGGYDLKITPSLYVNTRFDYTNNLVRIDWRRPDGTVWLTQVGFSAWANLSYAGVGGQDIILDRPDDEVGNEHLGPYGFVSLTKPIDDGPWSFVGQLYFRGGSAKPREGGLMDLDRPLGSDGGVYSALSAGVATDRVDRWPMPTRGYTLEAVSSLGATLASGVVHPLVGAQVEALGWLPLWPDRLTLGGRVLAHKTSGERPFFEQDKAGGRWRDELGSEQALAGYGRTRTRGDGVVAALVELRPHLFAIRSGTFDLAFHLSLTAELGWLFERSDPGPPLPTLGVGVPLLYQKVVQLRPFLAWGWRRQQPDDPRRPSMQVGISVLDAL